jgi:Endosomal/lysosomal potassium channel TMEM175
LLKKVLELKPPPQYTSEALAQLWPMLLSYAVSYLFIAIVWVNPMIVLMTANTPSENAATRRPHRFRHEPLRLRKNHAVFDQDHIRRSHSLSDDASACG